MKQKTTRNIQITETDSKNGKSGYITRNYIDNLKFSNKEKQRTKWLLSIAERKNHTNLLNFQKT